MDGRIEETLEGQTVQPVINIFNIVFTDNEGNRNLAGSLSLSILLLVNVFLGGFSHMTVTSRIVYAMARDGALPGSDYIKGVNKKLQLPVRSIIATFFLNSALVLLVLISDTTFDAITSISTIGYQCSYAIPILWRITYCKNTFKQGPYNLGRYSNLIGWISVIFLCLTSICFMFPTQFNENMKQEVDTFNYTSVVLAATFILMMIYWWFPKYGARYTYKGSQRPDDSKVE